MKVKRASIITKVVIISLIVYALISLAGMKQKIEDATLEQLELQQLVEVAMQKNAELSYAIQHAGDDETIEDIARSKLGLVRPGEIIFYDQSN